jgi:kumamolisin
LSDVADWLALADLPASLIGQVSQVDVNGGAPLGPGEEDALLAIVTILSTAPGAEVVVYHAPNEGPGTSFQALFNAMIDDGVTIISNSFVYCEDQTTDADLQSLDEILATAAASGISVLSATGDSGSTCNNGSAATVSVPASSPHVTAVGGTAAKLGPGATYGSETWWDGSAQVPPTGQGGFGASRFFSRPAYQDELISSPMRSIPDVVAVASPDLGTHLCQADAGGCPTAPVHGGTSLATPLWAAYIARINERVGHPLGFLNPLIYPLAGSDAFHSAARLDSDAAHVGVHRSHGRSRAHLL